MWSPASGLKFCGVRTRVACVISAHAASRVVILSLPLPNNTIQTFSGAKDSSLGRFLFRSVHLVVNIVKAMFKSIFFRLIFTPCCKYTYNKNNVKFSKPTASELRQELLKLNSLKVVHKSRSLSNPFPANHCSAFSNSHSFYCALYSDDSSWQTSDKKLRKY